MALDEREEVQEHLQDVDEGQDSNLDDRRMQVSIASVLATETSCALLRNPGVMRADVETPFA
jgi:hypothetical protein